MTQNRNNNIIVIKEEQNDGDTISSYYAQKIAASIHFIRYWSSLHKTWLIEEIINNKEEGCKVIAKALCKEEMKYLYSSPKEEEKVITLLFEKYNFNTILQELVEKMQKEAPPSRSEDSSVWNENSYLNRIDIYLSRLLIFRIRKLPYIIELLLTIPGNWFGSPIFALGIGPIFSVATIATTTTNNTNWWWLVLVNLPVTVIALYWWNHCLQNNMKHMLDAYFPGGFKTAKLVQFVLPHIAYFLCSFITNTSNTATGKQLSSFYICSYIITCNFVWYLKHYYLRLRPCINTLSTDELRKYCYRHFDFSLVLKRFDANHSFPSGDATGSATFATTTILFLVLLSLDDDEYSDYQSTGIKILLLTATAILTAFCRVFYHVHHLLDVFVGGMVGILLPCLLCLTIGIYNFKWWQIVVLQGLEWFLSQARHG